MRRTTVDKIRENIRLQQTYNIFPRYGWDMLFEKWGVLNDFRLDMQSWAAVARPATGLNSGQSAPDDREKTGAHVRQDGTNHLADSLQGVADALGLKIAESDWIERDSGSGIGADPAVREAIFSADVLVQGNNSPAIEIGDDHVVVLRILEHQPAAQQTLDSIREAVAEAVRQDRIRTLLEEKGAGLLAELDSGTATMDSVAAAESLKLESNTLLPRTARLPSQELVRRAFDMPLPQPDKPVYAGMLLSSGDYALISLEEVQQGDYDALPEPARKQAWRALQELEGSSDLQMVLGELKSQATIHIPREGDR